MWMPGGDIFLTGAFGGTVDFDPGPGNFALTTTYCDVFVLKLDSAGRFQWVNQLNNPGIFNYGCSALTTDEKGNVYIGGTQDIPSSSGSGFIWKLDASGSSVWTYHINGMGEDRVASLKWDPKGFIYAIGQFSDTVEFDNGSGSYPLVSYNGYNNFSGSDYFILKIDTAGNFIWAKPFVTSAINAGSLNSVILDRDASGNLYICGRYFEGMNYNRSMGASAFQSNGSSESAFILKLDPSGNYTWGQSIGVDPGAGAHCINVDRHGAIVTTGYFSNPDVGAGPDFDPGPGVVHLESVPFYTGFIQKLICNDTTTALLTKTVCGGFTLNGQTYTESGTYIQRIPNFKGCDSIITLNLTIPVLEPLINVSELTLSTTATYNTYQWLLNGSIIPGATGATYTVKENGDYTVKVTDQNGCEGVSLIYKVTNVPNSIDAKAALTAQIRVYPNPATDEVTIVNVSAARLESIRVVNILGAEVVRKSSQQQVKQQLNVRQLPAGIYLLQLQTSQGMVQYKLEVLR